jgi:peptide/nickel transport system ATP-binding protein
MADDGNRQCVFAVEELKVTFAMEHGEVQAVQGVSFSVDAGRTLAIVGESGSGKSVSLLAATGLLGAGNAVVEGRALHHGTDLVGLSPERLREIRGKDIGFVFQDPQSSLHPLKSIGTQIGEALTAHGRVRKRERRRRVIELLDEVGIKEPQRRIDDYPVHFSGGMRQRAMIAAAIALNPALLIADEATTALDVTVQASILSLLQRLQREHGTALIFVSHDLAVVSDIADDVVVMRSGEVVEAGRADVIYARPQHPYTVKLLGATQHVAARAVRTQHPAEREEPLLTVADVAKDFPIRGKRIRSFRAVEGVTFDIGKREIVGLVGESGSGKSTLGRIVSGLTRPSAGTVAFDGEVYNEVGRRPPRLDTPTRSRIQVVFQDPYGSLNPRHRIGAILAVPFVLQGGLARDQIRQEVVDLMRRVELPLEVIDRYPAHLSGGQRQRVAIARALALHPDLVVADEPVSALDVTTQDQILALIRHLRDELGVSFLFISHDLSVVTSLCDRVLVLNGGRIVEHGGTSELFANPTDPYTRLLVDSVPGKRRALALASSAPGGEPVSV